MMKYTHTNLIAKDWKKIADFYIIVFGCRLKPPERNLSGSWLDQATGLKGAALRGTHLSLPGYGETGPTLEIFSYQEMVNREPLLANHTGFTHIAFEVEDVQTTVQLAKQNGGSSLGQITEKDIAGVGLLTFVYIRDPENNIVEVQSWKK